MLSHLETRDVGPADHLRMDLAPRVNLLTGDNGLGKTFLLDIAWRVVTEGWAGLPARPRRAGESKIICSFAAEASQEELLSNGHGHWWDTRPGLQFLHDGIVIYVRVDGGFSVWDSIRWEAFEEDDEEYPFPYHFNSELFGRDCRKAAASAVTD